jgi:hypothetical protein
MNLTVLPINEMLSHSAQWLGDPALRARLGAHPVGAALLGEVARVHAHLAGQVERRRQLALTLAQLTELLAALDLVHDNMARAIHGVLEALLAATPDPAAAARYARLRDLLFPEGLSIVTRSYAYEAGAITALGARVTREDLEQMSAIQVGDQTVADWYRAWVDAGQQLGRHAHERAALLASAGRGGSASADTDTRAARREWIAVVQMLVGAFDLMRLAPEVREQILAPLDASVARALRRRAGDQPPADIPGEEPPAGAPGDEPSGEIPGEPSAAVRGDALLDVGPLDENGAGPEYAPGHPIDELREHAGHPGHQVIAAGALEHVDAGAVPAPLPVLLDQRVVDHGAPGQGGVPRP